MIKNILKLDYSIKFDNREVKYGIIGEGEALVVVHGTPWSSFNLREIIHGLSKKFKVYYFDLLGYGESSKEPGDVSLGIQNKLLENLLNHWNLKNPFILGHDFGGATVLRTHLLNKVKFKKMILIDPVAVSPWGSAFFKHVNRFEEAFAGTPDYIHEAIIETYIKTAMFKVLDEDILKKTVSYWIKDGGKEAFYRQIAQADSKYTDEVEVMYNSINIPVQIFWGKEDTWIPIERGEYLHQLIPNSQFNVIEDAGHLVIEEKADVLLEKIFHFLEN
eukprot:TRINITY_DN27871_c0_g2_i2.p1 TRINITY_DN27871_c0_g2~~TRINITY_DN27871_c0_g2_i2.p1  ORF type:complete len:275 (+),score=35.49 TRINITY_DN27871_c0_g2_i2:48-872(+)